MEDYNSFKQEDNILIHKRILDAPIDLVWEVWTTPDHVKEWWGANGFSLTTKSMTLKTSELQDFIMHGMGRDWDNKIEYIEVKRPSLFIYRHTGEKEKDWLLMIYKELTELQFKKVQLENDLKLKESQ